MSTQVSYTPNLDTLGHAHALVHAIDSSVAYSPHEVWCLQGNVACSQHLMAPNMSLPSVQAASGRNLVPHPDIMPNSASDPESTQLSTALQHATTLFATQDVRTEGREEGALVTKAPHSCIR